MGGPVRDLLLGRASPDLDIALEGPVDELAEALAERLSGALRKTTQFMTCTLVLADGSELDIAHARTERYPWPGALPVVAPARIEDDLRRRDFTVNAMAVRLAPGRFGELLDPHGGLEDLRAGLLRVLHGRSFEDDPTRMLRAARFVLRLGFALEERTREALARAVAQRRPRTVSGARLRNELRRLFEECPTGGLGALQELNLMAAMDLAPASAAAIGACRHALAALSALGLQREQVRWIALCLGLHAGLSGDDPDRLAERLMLSAVERADLRGTARLVAAPPAALLTDARDSELH
ncbi:MAG: hypothetical protein AB7Y46_20985, partial [Armatimonadota bacterium]